MPIDAQDSGFLSRWSRRKELARQGVAVAEAAPPAPAAIAVSEEFVPSAPAAALPLAVDPAVAAPRPSTAVDPTLAEEPAEEQAEEPAEEPAVQAPPTLADVALLKQDSDFSRFVGRSVQPDVKNAALAKLFRDPHFNVMDRLDVYIDDYGKPDPIPASMLRQMLQAQVLGLFDDEDKPKVTTLDTAQATTQNTTDLVVQTAAADAVDPADPTVQLACDAAPLTEPAADENTDLQLQPDDDTGRPGLAAGAGQNTGCTH